MRGIKPPTTWIPAFAGMTLLYTTLNLSPVDVQAAGGAMLFYRHCRPAAGADIFIALPNGGQVFLFFFIFRHGETLLLLLL
jgi:hypothetical protein